MPDDRPTSTSVSFPKSTRYFISDRRMATKDLEGKWQATFALHVSGILTNAHMTAYTWQTPGQDPGWLVHGQGSDVHIKKLESKGNNTMPHALSLNVVHRSWPMHVAKINLGMFSLLQVSVARLYKVGIMLWLDEQQRRQLSSISITRVVFFKLQGAFILCCLERAGFTTQPFCSVRKRCESRQTYLCSKSLRKLQWTSWTTWIQSTQ